MKAFSILFLLILIQTISDAQVEKNDRMNSWVTYSGNHKLNNKIGVHTLYSFRRSDFVKYWDQSLLRLGMNYQVKKNLLVTLGGDWVENFSYDEQNVAEMTYEYRIFEQLKLKNSIGILKLSHRYKMEQRFIENVDKLRNRFRYRLTVQCPINHKGMSENTFFVSVFDELFINLGNNVGTHYFDQNWTYLGLGYKFNKSTKISVGFLNQFILKSDNVKIKKNRILSISFSHSLDFST